MQFRPIGLVLVLILIILFSGCLQFSQPRLCQDFNGIICAQGDYCSEGYYEVTDGTDCCAVQCGAKVLVEQETNVLSAFAGTGSYKCELQVESVKAIVLVKDAKFSLDYGSTKIRGDEDYYYEFVPDLGGWVKNERILEIEAWTKIREASIANPQSVSCTPEEFGDESFTVKEQELVQPPVEEE